MSAKFIFADTSKQNLRQHMAKSIWLETPDSSVLTAAKDNSGFIKQLLDSEKSQRFVESMLMHHYKIDKLTSGVDSEKSKDRFQVMSLMQEETRLFLWDIFKNNKPISDILTSRTTFANAELGKHYGFEVASSEFTKVELPAGRQGILTQGSFLTKTSKPLETNIIARGLFIVENVFCKHIPAPPPVPPEETANESVTPRERLEKHRENATCRACHEIMDPPGFALENFGPLGQYRDTYVNGRQVDSRADFKDGTVTKTPAEFLKYATAQKESFQQCVAEELLKYILRRSLTPDDQCAIDAVSLGMTEKNWGMQTTLTEIMNWYEK